jgi:hypothetical protein
MSNYSYAQMAEVCKKTFDAAPDKYAEQSYLQKGRLKRDVAWGYREVLDHPSWFGGHKFVFEFVSGEHAKNHQNGCQ